MSIDKNLCSTYCTCINDTVKLSECDGCTDYKNGECALKAVENVDENN